MAAAGDEKAATAEGDEKAYADAHGRLMDALRRAEAAEKR
jgi:hypothetical protein